MKLRVLIVSNQVRGIDGTGGLGDVATALPKALAHEDDIDVRVLMPGFKTVSGIGVDNRFETVLGSDFAIPFGDLRHSARVCVYNLPRATPDEPLVPCYLLCTEPFDQSNDSPEQAILLSRGTVEFLRTVGNFDPDLIHCNDWHSGLIPVYLNTLYRRDPHLGRIATLYTTHNTGYYYQGAFPDDNFRAPVDRLLFLSGLDPALFQPMQTRSLEHQGRLNFTKGGLGFADLINTVSITYSHEIRTAAFGGGFDRLLQERSSDLCGIVNGIDTHEWNPADDPLIAPCNFSKSDSAETIAVRKGMIRSLLRKWRKSGTPPFAKLEDASMLMAFVGRITDQKAAILMPVLEALCGWEQVQIVLLGSVHPQDPLGRQYADRIRRLSQVYRQRLFFFEGFETALSHLIYAAADLFLMPSVYEPCGLAQLISMRHATLPLVRFVGGLADTVIDEQAGAAANGFGFKEAVADGSAMSDIPQAAELLLATVKRALTLFREKPQRWRQLMMNAIALEVSWAVPARQYQKIYEAAIRERVRSRFLSAS